MPVDTVRVTPGLKDVMLYLVQGDTCLRTRHEVVLFHGLSQSKALKASNSFFLIFYLFIMNSAGTFNRIIYRPLEQSRLTPVAVTEPHGTMHLARNSRKQKKIKNTCPTRNPFSSKTNKRCADFRNPLTQQFLFPSETSRADQALLCRGRFIDYSNR